MRNIIAFDTSTKWVYITRLKEDKEKKLILKHHEIKKIPKNTDTWFYELLEEKLKSFRPNAIAIGEGPGSFTGLRISYTYARILGMKWDIPIIPFHSLELWQSAFNISKNDFFIIPANKNVFYMYDLKKKKSYAVIKENLKTYLHSKKNKFYFWPHALLTNHQYDDEILSLENINLLNKPSLKKIKLPVSSLEILDTEPEKYVWKNAQPKYGHKLEYTKK
ncbi:MAG: hypothetical protein OEZ22_09055 [Spirochaetia bacterium]|nr:hypothetical protein [Spirochaetia bacterium]